MKKQAQSLTLSQRFRDPAKRSKMIHPIRFVGRKALRSRSEVYRNAMDLVDKSDDLIRDLIRRQQEHLKEMRKHARALSYLHFSNSAFRFVREQKAINSIVHNMRVKFAEIAGKDKNINLAINRSLGQTPDGEYEREDHKQYIEEQLGKLSGLIDSYYNFSKTAYWGLAGGGYWGSLTSGKSMKKGLEMLFNKFKSVFVSNIDILKELDRQRSMGDPGEYLNNMNKIVDIEKYINAFGPKEKEIWNMLAEPQQKEEIAPEPEPKAPNDGKKQEPVAPVAPVVPAAPAAPIVQSPAPLASPGEAKPEGTKTLLSMPSVEPEKPEKPVAVSVVQPKPNNDNNKDEAPKTIVEPQAEKTSSLHDKFLYKLAKRGNSGASQKEIALYMLKYANKIDQIDSEYAEKLTAIAEGVLNA